MQTVKLSDYKECKEYAMNQARVLNNEDHTTAKVALDLDFDENQDKKET